LLRIPCSAHSSSRAPARNLARSSSAGIASEYRAIVSDGGGIFYANQAMSVYQALGIEKKRIDPKQAWQNYRETMFN
jgi:hypothetical protein